MHQFIIENGKEVIKNKPNTIVVVDKNTEGQPYLVTVDTERLIDADVRENGSMTYIAFKHSTDDQGVKRVAFYDEDEYSVFIVDEKKNDYKHESTVEHKIGYCPARCFIKTPLNSKNYFKRETAIGMNIGKVREWQLFTTYKYYAEHYASFPVVEKMKAKCNNDECVNGKIPRPNGTYFADGERMELPMVDCPHCAQADSVGIGTVVRITPSKGKEDDNGKGIFKFIAPEIEGVTYLGKKLVAMETELDMKVVGVNTEVAKEAINEKQVGDNAQSRENVLLDLKELFEEIYIWICETSARAYFLGDVQIIVYANLGTEFYLVSEDDLQKRYDNAKKIGLPEAEVDQLYKQLILTKYKDNPDSIQRMELLKIVDPAPYADFDEVEKLKDKGVITQNEYIIKRRFINFVNRLEFENTSLVNFGKRLPLSERVTKINNILNTYANEYIKNNPTEPVGTSKGSLEEVKV